MPGAANDGQNQRGSQAPARPPSLVATRLRPRP
jgi:hypothetical protein